MVMGFAAGFNMGAMGTCGWSRQRWMRPALITDEKPFIWMKRVSAFLGAVRTQIRLPGTSDAGHLYFSFSLALEKSWNKWIFWRLKQQDFAGSVAG